jgi:hypothetical protein
MLPQAEPPSQADDQHSGSPSINERSPIIQPAIGLLDLSLFRQITFQGTVCILECRRPEIKGIVLRDSGRLWNSNSLQLRATLRKAKRRRQLHRSKASQDQDQYQCPSGKNPTPAKRKSHRATRNPWRLTDHVGRLANSRNPDMAAVLRGVPAGIQVPGDTLYHGGSGGIVDLPRFSGEPLADLKACVSN